VAGGSPSLKRAGTVGAASKAWEVAAREAQKGDRRNKRELRRSAVGENPDSKRDPDSRSKTVGMTPTRSDHTSEGGDDGELEDDGSVFGGTDAPPVWPVSSPLEESSPPKMAFEPAPEQEKEQKLSERFMMNRPEMPATPLGALQLKAMAAKLRKKVHIEANRPSGGSYASLEVEGLRADDHGPSRGDEEEGSEGRGAGASRGGGDMAALASIFCHPFTVLLLALPLGIFSHLRRWGALCTFWLNILALIPLAKILGDGTEELAAAIRNDTISGLLNATLGNAVEMILTVQTMRKGLLDVVKATLLGSILSNILLVLGTSFLLGGLVGSKTNLGRHHVIYDEEYQASRCTMEKEQIFSSKSALVSMAMQLLACMSCALPTVFVEANRSAAIDSDEEVEMDAKILQVSRIAAVIIMFSYVAYIMFQLVTHKKMLTIDEGADSDDEDDDDEGGLSAGGALLLMAATTGVIAISSEMLVGAIEEVVANSTISSSFIGIILLPFAGNACEHASAIRFAIQDRPGLSIGIAVGSSTQIALFVVPFAVIAGKLIDQPMDLVFGSLNTTVMILSVLVALALVIDGRSNWLKGFMLCTAYIFEGILYWNEG